MDDIQPQCTHTLTHESTYGMVLLLQTAHSHTEASRPVFDCGDMRMGVVLHNYLATFNQSFCIKG